MTVRANISTPTKVGAVIAAFTLACAGLYVVGGRAAENDRADKRQQNLQMARLHIKSAFEESVRNGDVSRIDALLEANPSLREECSSALSNAAYRGDSAAVRLLAERGWSVDPPKDKGYALTASASGGHAETVGLLLRLGARPDAHSDGEPTPLIYAAIHGRASIARLLLDAGANPNLESDPAISGPRSRSKRGEVNSVGRIDRSLLSNPLLWAIHNNHADVVALLLAYGADPNAMSRTGVTAVQSAKTLNRKAILRLLNLPRSSHKIVPGSRRSLPAAKP